jgi:hypothetical protein
MARSDSLGLDIPIKVARLNYLALHIDKDPEQFIKLSHEAFLLIFEVPQPEWARFQYKRRGLTPYIADLESIIYTVIRHLEQSRLKSPWVSDPKTLHHIFPPKLVGILIFQSPRAATLARNILSLNINFCNSLWLESFFEEFISIFRARSSGHITPAHPSFLFNFLFRRISIWHQELLMIFAEIRRSTTLLRNSFWAKKNEWQMGKDNLEPLSKYNPVLALACLQTLREILGNSAFTELAEMSLNPATISNIFRPRTLLDLNAYNPKSMVIFFEILRELGGERLVEEFTQQKLTPEIVDGLFHPRNLLSISTREPKAALEYLQVLRYLRGTKGIETYRKHLLDPDVASDYLEGLGKRRGLDAEKAYRQRLADPIVSKVMLDPELLVDHHHRNPQGMVIYLRLVHELVGERFLEPFAQPDQAAFCAAMVLLDRLRDTSFLNINSLCAALSFACLVKSRKLSVKLCQALEDVLARRPGFASPLLDMPLSAFRDLRWLVHHHGSPKLRSLLEDV